MIGRFLPMFGYGIVVWIWYSLISRSYHVRVLAFETVMRNIFLSCMAILPRHNSVPEGNNDLFTFACLMAVSEFSVV